MNARPRTPARGATRPRLVALVIAVWLAGCSGESHGRLPAVADPQLPVSVSGISSGGYMATQFHVAHSALVAGAGLLASGPYRCAGDSLEHALGRCIKGSPPIPIEELLSESRALALEGRIDPIENLADDRVWILHGSADTIVAKPVVDALEAWYRALLEPAQLARVERAGTAHTFPTLDAGSGCDRTETPFLGACGYDAAGTLLAHLLGTLQPADPARGGRLIEFDQQPYAEPAGSRGLAKSGWVFVPEACAAAPAGCRLHVVFHGCQQSAAAVGERFVTGSGYLEPAAANRIVLLFPQIEPSFVPLNPKGCWDWWGYEREDYALRSGPQIAAVRAMVAALRGEAESAGAPAR